MVRKIGKIVSKGRLKNMSGYYDNHYEYDFWLKELGRVLENNDAFEEVVSLVKREEYQELICMITKLLTVYREQETELELIKNENEQLKSKLEQYKIDENSKIVPPALRKDLYVKEMYEKYKETGSYSEVAKTFDCDRKTVIYRLRKAGYIQ